MVWLSHALEFYLNVLGIYWFGSGILLPCFELCALALFIQKALSQKPLATSDKVQPKSELTRVALLSSEQMHTNFFNYANGFRIEEAKKALAESSQLIINLAYDVGFNSKSIFNSAFKKAEGCSPSGYRKQLIDNIESQKVA